MKQFFKIVLFFKALAISFASVAQSLDAGSISVFNNVTTVCSGDVHEALSLSGTTGGTAPYSYVWLQKAGNATDFTVIAG